MLGALVVMLAAMQASFEPRDVWKRIQWAQPPDVPGEVDTGSAEAAPISGSSVNAMQLGLQSCETCGLLSRPVPGKAGGRCPRCGDRLEFRKPASVQRTWAFLVAAAICYVPANV